MDLTPQQNSNATSDGVDNFTFMMFMMIAAVILYLIRPNSLRRRNNNDGLIKPISRDNVSFSFLLRNFSNFYFYCQRDTEK